MRPIPSTAAICCLAGTGFAAETAASDRPQPFEEAAIFVEQNAADGDTEVVISGTAGDDGLTLLRIHTPDKRRVVKLLSTDASIRGIREFHFESPEPPGEAILAAYPEGRYVLYGESTAGDVFRSALFLSHELPPAVTILHPADESQVPDEALVVRWSSAAGVARIQLEIENESADPERALVIDLPARATSFRVPNAFIVPGGEYQVGLHTVHENGNIVVVESTFAVED